MKCLVFGGSGFIGSHLCERLLQEGHQVCIFSRSRFSGKNIIQFMDKVEYIEGDFNNVDNFEEFLKGVDIVFHCISTTLPKTSNDNPIFDVTTNIVPTLKMLNAARDCEVKKVIFFSSGGTVYGMPKQIPITEEHSTDPICSYGIQKVTIEKYLNLYYYLYGLDYTIIRVANPYGERQGWDSGQGVIPIFTRKLLKEETIEIWGDGLTVRDYIYIEDLIDAVIKMLYYNGQYKVFNVGSGQGKSLLEVVECISSMLNKPCNIRFSSARKLDVPINILDINRAETHLNWAPKYSFEEGVRLTVSGLYKGAG